MSKYVGKIVTNQAPAGYSVYFDGNGDYLTVAANAAFQFGTGDFTIEYWYYPTSFGTNTPIDMGYANAGSYVIQSASDGKPYFYSGSTGIVFTATTGYTLNAWNHLAVSRSGTTLSMFINGARVGSATNSTNFNANFALGIGGSPTHSTVYEVIGYMSNVRLVKGTAVYDPTQTSIRVPTQLLRITNTSILTCNSPAIVDQSSNAFAITTNGNAVVSTFTPFAAYNPAPTSSNPLTPAPGVWSLDEALQYTQQGVWPSYAVNAIEDVFSTYLYTGTGAAQSINNGISIGNTAQANTSNTTASSIRAGSSLADFFSSGSNGIFNSFSAGQNLTTDYGTSVSITTVTYKNSVGSDWAPTSVLVQYSSDNTNWTTAATYSDDGSTNLQTITVSSGSGRYWRMYQNSNTRANSAGYEWHLNSFTMRNSDAKGGLVWIKNRSGVADHALTDTARGAGGDLISNSTSPQGILANGLTSFNSNGFSVGTLAKVNSSGQNFASWTFREQAKFFDVVTFTAQSSGTQTINHNLGSAPGCMILKSTSDTDNWVVYHRTLTSTQYLTLNTTAAVSTQTNMWPSVTSTSFDVSIGNTVTASRTYVAYLFAHNAGGFGATGSDNVISCGSFNAASVTTTTLGYEPQWLMFKQSDGVGNWRIVDNMRGWPASGNPQELNPNLSAAETSNGGVNIISTGFTNVIGSGNWIYIAIRRGPMRPPTSGTSVFLPQSPNASGSFPCVTTGWPVDMGIVKINKTTVDNNYIASRLVGDAYQFTNTTGIQQSGGGSFTWDSNVGWLNLSGANLASWNFRRAPGFFDVVCYTGTGSATTFNHNLTVVPELMIIKKRNSATNGGWLVGYYVSASTVTDGVGLNTTDALSTRAWSSSNFNSAPTSTVFGVGGFGVINAASDTYVAYLFATVAGVSKVGSYTGTGALQTINCGFAAGARFVLIKRTDSTGDWYVYDSARGITSGNDPYLLLNSTAAEVTGTNYVDTASTGFQVTAAAPAGLNASGGSYIFLAIA